MKKTPSINEIGRRMKISASLKAYWQRVRDALLKSPSSKLARSYKHRRKAISLGVHLFRISGLSRAARRKAGAALPLHIRQLEAKQIVELYPKGIPSTRLPPSRPPKAQAPEGRRKAGAPQRGTRKVPVAEEEGKPVEVKTIDELVDAAEWEKLLPLVKSEKEAEEMIRKLLVQAAASIPDLEPRIIVEKNADGSIDGEVLIRDIPTGRDPKEICDRVNLSLPRVDGLWLSVGYRMSPEKQLSPERYGRVKGMNQIELYPRSMRYKGTAFLAATTGDEKHPGILENIHEKLKDTPVQMFVRIHWNPENRSPKQYVESLPSKVTKGKGFTDRMDKLRQLRSVRYTTKG